MSARTGGVASAFGFRYQYLITVELLLELYDSGTTGWSVDVDRADQDSADILVFRAGRAAPEAAIQVKASLEASSTTLGLPAHQRIVHTLRGEHPHAQEYRVVTNRDLTGELATLSQDPVFREPAARVGRVVFDHRCETLYDLAASLLARIEKIRRRGRGGVGHLVHHLILRNLVDLVHEHGAREVDQRITSADVAAVLNVTPPSSRKRPGRGDGARPTNSREDTTSSAWPRRGSSRARCR